MHVVLKHSCSLIGLFGQLALFEEITANISTPAFWDDPLEGTSEARKQYCANDSYRLAGAAAGMWYLEA